MHRWIAMAVLGLAACGEEAPPAPEAEFGPNPALVQPDPGLIPTIAIAPAVGWAPGAAPVAAAGFAVAAFASGLDHPRMIHVLPNGDVLVAESNAPERPDDMPGLKGWIAGWVMGRAGATVPSADRITLLRDADGDGVAETRAVFLDRLTSPFGMALVGRDLYVANTDAVVRFDYAPGALSATGPGAVVAALPAGTINHHWTKSLVASRDGQRLYVGVGSNSNIAENGLEAEAGRAAIWEIALPGGAARVFAEGLRNPVGMDWQPDSGALWVVVNERDELGDQLVPDYLTSVRQDGFYGWPWSYFGGHVDARVQPPRPDRVAGAIAPDYALGAHTASLGLAFYDAGLFGAEYRGGAFIGQHGSWNRSTPSGYKVIFVPFAAGAPSGPLQDVLTGFLDADGNARGRPVGVAVDATGALLVADDVGNTIWRVIPR